MSRIGLQEIIIEDGVTVQKEGTTVTVTGPLGEIKIGLAEGVELEMQDNTIKVSVKGKTKQDKSNHGTHRALIQNAISGVKEGFSKTLELVGVGYRARMEGNKLVMSLGLNHPVEVEPYEGITLEVPEETKIVVKGFDKQKVGEFAAKIRELRKPEPYKGKGIRYENEYVRRKSSKANLATETE
jgi:large subunit ribosomal protein L6